MKINNELFFNSYYLLHLTRAFIEDSQASIKISPQDHNFGLNDRVVTLTGSLEEQKRAILLILSKLTEDAQYSQSANAPFSYAGVAVVCYSILFFLCYYWLVRYTMYLRILLLYIKAKCSLIQFSPIIINFDWGSMWGLL